MEESKTVGRTSAALFALLVVGALPIAADQVILDDLIVDGSICVGFDCVNGESFGFDTIRIKENNLRIKAQDTSNSASFPTNDWQITFNDSSNGGAEKFSIDDIDGGRTPFTIEASAPSNSLYVEDSGEIGFGTSNPVVNLHVVDGNTPTLRLEQDGSSGFTPQTWDVAGNEANFFIRDATNGSTLPIRLRPGAPTSAIDIAADGDIGIGTSSPSTPLHIRRTSSGAGFLLETTGGSVTDSDWFFQANTVTGALIITNTNGGAAPIQVFPGQSAGLLVLNGNRVGIGKTAAAGSKLDVDGAIFQRGSSLHPDYVFEPDYDLETIDEHGTYMWENKHLPAVGPGRYDEEGKALIELGGRSQALLEELEKAHIYIQQLHERVKQLESRVGEQ